MTIEARFCPRCGTQRVPGMQFCASCGLNLSDPAVAPIAPAGQVARSQPPFETLEIVDRDSGEMPVQANLMATALGTNAVIRHYLVAHHRWPGNSEEFLIAEYGLNAGQTPEMMSNRAHIQTVLDDFRRTLLDFGWEQLPRSPVWYALSFQRRIEEGTTPGPIAPPEAAEEMEAIHQKAVARVVRSTRPMGTSFSLGTFLYWIAVLFLIVPIGYLLGGGQASAQGLWEGVFLVAFIAGRVLAYRRWKRSLGEE